MDGIEHPILFISKALSPAEQNYSATELECAALIWALIKLLQYVDSSNFEVITNHVALIRAF